VVLVPGLDRCCGGRRVNERANLGREINAMSVVWLLARSFGVGGRALASDSLLLSPPHRQRKLIRHNLSARPCLPHHHIKSAIIFEIILFGNTSHSFRVYTVRSKLGKLKLRLYATPVIISKFT